jgi:hypothetical protein
MSMPNTRPAVTLDAMPPAHELRIAASLGMTYNAWREAGEPMSRPNITKRERACRPFFPYRSKWEAEYATYLDIVLAPTFAIWDYEPERLEIGIGAKYTPDFRITHHNGPVEFHEVKGYRREAAMVRIRAAALRYPEYKFVLVTKVDGRWHYTTIGTGQI